LGLQHSHLGLLMNERSSASAAAALQEPERKAILRRVANIYDCFKPVLWSFGDVSVLTDEEGYAVGFYCKKADRIRKDIPVEIFNHQLKELDLNDPDELAAFMSEYGTIFDSWRDSASEMARYNKFIDIQRYGRPDKDRIDNEKIAIGSPINLTPPSMGRLATRELWLDECERMRRFEADGWNGYEPRLFLVSYEEVVENIELIFEIVRLAKAATQSQDEDMVARLAGIDREIFFDESLYLDQMLNGLLHVFQPKIGFQYVVDGEEGEPTYHCDLFDIHDYAGSSSASFMNAVALQIRDFNINGCKARQCAECGEIFVVKQTFKQSKRSHSDSMFCCDRCKGRNAQRKHRNTEGYKLKQARKKATPAQ